MDGRVSVRRVALAAPLGLTTSSSRKARRAPRSCGCSASEADIENNVREVVRVVRRIGCIAVQSDVRSVTTSLSPRQMLETNRKSCGVCMMTCSTVHTRDVYAEIARLCEGVCDHPQDHLVDL